MDLFILRHGKAGQNTGDPSSDRERVLTKEGRADLLTIAQWIASEDYRFDLIATSPLRRAYESAEIVARFLKARNALAVWEELTPGSDPKDICSRLSGMNERSVLLVGHEPLLGALIGYVISRGAGASVVLGKGGMAKIRDVQGDAPPSGELHWLLTPRQIRDLR